MKKLKICEMSHSSEILETWRLEFIYKLCLLDLGAGDREEGRDH